MKSRSLRAPASVSSTSACAVPSPLTSMPCVDERSSLTGRGEAKRTCRPKAEREAWQRLITGYLEGRAQLKVVVSIVDAEVGPTADDLAMLDLLADHATEHAGVR